MFDRTQRWVLTLVASAAVFYEAPARAALPLGGEFQVNSYTTYNQYFTEVAVAANGAFVVIWTSREQDGSGAGIFAQRFDNLGSKVGGELQVNSFTAAFETYGKIAAEPEGDFVVVWSRRFAIGEADIFGQRFSSSGAKLASEFQVNTYTTGGQYYPAVAVDADGDFVVVWTGLAQDADATDGVFGQRFNSSGARLGVEFEINTLTTSTQRTAAIGMESNGDFVVSWDSLSDADSSFGVRAQRWSSAGAKLGVEFAVNTYTTSLQFGSAVGVDTDGDFVIAWTSIEHDGDSAQDVFGQRYNSSGARVGGEFQVNTASGSQFLTTFYAAPHALGIDTDGDFVVAWTSDIAPGLQGQRFASTGARIGGEFQVSVYSGTFHKRAATAMKANGDFVVAFNSYGRDDGGYAVFARRFTFVRELDIDDNGAVEPLTDGLLVLRRLFGFSGATLTAAAVGPNCGRCNAAAIEPYLDSLLPFLDIDASGEVGALTDGLLILRRLFGFSGSSLINGALTGDCTRCEAGAVAAYIDDL